MRYFVTIEDENGKKIEVEVTEKIFEVFEDDRKLKERQRNERRFHYDKRGIEDYIIANEQSRFLKSADDIYIDREAIKKALDSCTPTQRRRFCLNKIYGYTYAEIAKLEGCSVNVIFKSVSAVTKKLKDLN